VSRYMPLSLMTIRPPMIKPQAYETEVIDKLFLELSQVTRATTGKELRLTERLAEVSARAEKAEQFREAVIDALVVSCIYVEEHDTNPRKAINDLICWEQKIALDPAVSSDARALIERAVAGCAEDCAIQVAAREKVEPENARLREALAELVRLDDQYRPDPAPHEWSNAWTAARTALGGE
jgi:hypothetical protein